MFEALISLTLLSMQPPLGNAGMEWAKELQSFSSEIAHESPLTPKDMKKAPQPSGTQTQLDLSMPDEQASAAELSSFLDSGILSNREVTIVYSDKQKLPSYEWFKKHRNWISIDKRILNTRGDDALFQDWSPL